MRLLASSAAPIPANAAARTPAAISSTPSPAPDARQLAEVQTPDEERDRRLGDQRQDELPVGESPCAVSTTSLAKYSAEKNSAEAPVTVASSWSLATVTTYKRTAPQTGLSALSLLAQSDTGLRLAGDCQGGGRDETARS